MTPIEIMARAMQQAAWSEGRFEPMNAHDDAAELVKAAITALEANGFAIAPVTPTFDMKMAGAAAITADIMKANANYDAACDCWPAMIAAA